MTTDWMKPKTVSEMRASIEADGHTITRIRKLRGRSTVRYTDGDGIERIRYHDTDVLTFNADGSIILDSGGYETVTTKRRMNEYAPHGFGVHQDKHVWYVSQYHGNGIHGPAIRYFDGMVLPRAYNRALKLTIADVRRANKETGNHFFSRDTMRFFHSKIESRILARAHDTRHFFITSEIFCENGPRVYTIREALKRGAEIETVGTREYTSKEMARIALDTLV